MNIIKSLSQNDSAITIYGPTTYMVTLNESSGSAVFATIGNNQIHLVDDTAPDIDFSELFENTTGTRISSKGIVFKCDVFEEVISGSEASILIELVAFNKSHSSFPASELLRILSIMKGAVPLNDVIVNLTAATEEELSEFLISQDSEMVKLAYQNVKQAVFYRRLAAMV